MNIFLSIALPVYNGADYLEEAIQSVLGQSFTNFEFVIVDNHSTDATYSIIQKYAAADNRIKYYRNEQTTGQVDNVNRAWKYCTGEWIQFFCHDDIMLPGCLQCLHEQIDLHKANEEIGLIGHSPAWLFSNHVIHNPGFAIAGKFIYTAEIFQRDNKLNYFSSFKVHEYKAVKSLSALMDFSKGIYLPALTTALVKKEVMEHLLGFDRQYMHFDIFAWSLLLFKYDYLHIDLPLTLTRIHSNQVAVDARKSLQTIKDNQTFYKLFLKRCRAIIPITFSNKLYVLLMPISTACGIISVELIKGSLKNAFSILFKLPVWWWPIILLLLPRNYPRERNRTQILSKFVPLNLIYP